MAAIAGLAMAGVGIGLFPEPWLAHLVRQGRLVELASENPLPPLHYHLHWRRDDTRPTMARLRDMAVGLADYSRPNALWGSGEGGDT